LHRDQSSFLLLLVQKCELKLLIHDRLHFALLHRNQREFGPSVQVAQKAGKVSLVVEIFGCEPAVSIGLNVPLELEI